MVLQSLYIVEPCFDLQRMETLTMLHFVYQLAQAGIKKTSAIYRIAGNIGGI